MIYFLKLNVFTNSDLFGVLCGLTVATKCLKIVVIAEFMYYKGILNIKIKNNGFLFTFKRIIAHQRQCCEL